MVNQLVIVSAITLLIASAITVGLGPFVEKIGLQSAVSETLWVGTKYLETQCDALPASVGLYEAAQLTGTTLRSDWAVEPVFFFEEGRVGYVKVVGSASAQTFLLARLGKGEVDLGDASAKLPLAPRLLSMPGGHDVRVQVRRDFTCS